MKKNVLTIFSIVLSFMVLIGLYLFLSNIKPTQTNTLQQLPTPTPIYAPSQANKTTLSPSQTVLQSEPGKIPVSGIYVKDFLNNPSDPNGNAIIEANDNFTILYLSNENKFSIIINNSPFASNRQLAEQAFLKDLGISENDACKLNVTISSPSRINPDETGQTFLLSFCNQ